MDANDPSIAPQDPAALEAPPPPSTPAGQPPDQASTEPPVPRPPRRLMCPVKCTKCGAGFEVPFNPDPNRPILCRTCRPVYPATCATCGRKCEVPFKVPPDRPYRCRTCEALPAPKQEKPKDPARQAAKDAIRAVFKEVGDREPTPEEAARIVGLCRDLYYGAPPRAVGAQPIAVGGANSPAITAPPKEARKAEAARPAPPRPKGARAATVPLVQLKVSQPLRPEQLPRDVLPREGDGSARFELVFALAAIAGKPPFPIRATFNTKNYRRALKAIDEHGGNATIILQGRLTGDGELLDAGISVQPNKAPQAKEAADPVQGTATPTAEAPKKPPRPNEVAGASAPSTPTLEKKAPALPAPPFVVRPGERIGRWTVVHESPLKGGIRQVHCRCKKCGFGIDLAVDELLAPVLPLCRRCE